MYKIILAVISLLCSCSYSNVHSYYSKDCNLNFTIEERGNEDVLIIEKSDSIFFKPQHGHYLGICFYVLDSLKEVYIGPYFNVIRHSEKNYKIKYIDKSFKGLEVNYPLLGNNFWGFQGGCDQGNYTFSVYHDSAYISPSLEPLEWK